MAPNAAFSDSAKTPDLHNAETTDFLLGEGEVAKGSHAYETYLDSIRVPERRRLAADALDTLALIITGGVFIPDYFRRGSDYSDGFGI